MIERMTIGQARRVALAAQGLATPQRGGSANWTRISAAIQQMNLLQIDSVNVLVRSHYLPVFSRVGHYAHDTLDQRTFTNRKRTMFECWAHEASLLPLELHPLMRWRMHRARNGNGVYKSMNEFARDEQAYVRSVLAFVEKSGPTTVSDLPDAGKGPGGWWGWSKGKMALECLFDQGLVTTATRRSFERVYDVPERVIPAAILALPTPPEPEAMRAQILLAARALGIATEIDLRDYFRLPLEEGRRAVHELVEDGTLQPISVKGWKQQAYVLAGTKIPRKAEGRALLSPFDPVVWERSRAERLFDFTYRIEIYTPAEKRKFGYYVLPFLMGDRIVARVCLKADRQAGVLRANAVHHEEHAEPRGVASALADELRLMSRWLGLDGNVAVGSMGDLSPQLKAAL